MLTIVPINSNVSNASEGNDLGQNRPVTDDTIGSVTAVDPTSADPASADPNSANPIGIEPSAKSAIPVIEDSELSTELRSTLMRLGRRLRNQRAWDEVTECQLSVLAYLVRNGPTAPKQLSRWERVTPPSMNRTLNSLEERGLAERNPDASDGRMITVSLTETGRELVIETRRRRDAWLHDQLGALSLEERNTIGEATALLRAIVER